MAFQHDVTGKGLAGLALRGVDSFAWHGLAWLGWEGDIGKAGMFVGVRYGLSLTCIVGTGT